MSAGVDRWRRGVVAGVVALLVLILSPVCPDAAAHGGHHGIAGCERPTVDSGGCHGTDGGGTPCAPAGSCTVTGSCAAVGCGAMHSAVPADGPAGPEPARSMRPPLPAGARRDGIGVPPAWKPPRPSV